MLHEIGPIGATKNLDVSSTIEEALNSRRVQYARVSHWCLLELLRQGQAGRFIKVKGLPDDAMIVGLTGNTFWLTQQLAIKVWSASFPEVQEGAVIPELTLECSVYEEQAGYEQIPVPSPDGKSIEVRLVKRKPYWQQ